MTIRSQLEGKCQEGENPGKWVAVTVLHVYPGRSRRDKGKRKGDDIAEKGGMGCDWRE